MNDLNRLTNSGYTKFTSVYVKRIFFTYKEITDIYSPFLEKKKNLSFVNVSRLFRNEERISVIKSVTLSSRREMDKLFINKSWKMYGL